MRRIFGCASAFCVGNLECLIRIGTNCRKTSDAYGFFFDGRKPRPVRLYKDSILIDKSGRVRDMESTVVEPCDSSSDANESRETELMRFLAELYASRTPDNCDGKDCRYRSGWCFHAAHGEVYSQSFKSETEPALNQEKASRASD
jgi:hypothetical protein